MRLLLLHIILFAVIDLACARTIVPILPAVKCIDLETTTNVALEAWRPYVNHLALELRGITTPSNNVEVAFGVDGNTNGVLECAEIDCVVGWDCGAWFVRRGIDGMETREQISLGNERGNLSWTVWLNAGNGKPKRLDARSNDVSLFQALSRADWIYNPQWNLMRLTGRGLARHEESVSVQVAPEAIVIRVR